MILVLMGVTGCGKSTIGRLLASKLGWLFEDADWYHPVENIKKMSEGSPLTDEDRWPWLDHLAEMIRDWSLKKENVVLACSALKAVYRERLNVTDQVRFVYLKCSQSVIEERLKSREDHFMDAKLVPSQFATLEEPGADEAIIVDAAKSVEECVEELASVYTVP
jgi:gluconokinase